MTTQRTIKFRGKRVDNGEWVYGDLLLNNGSPIIVQQVSRGYISHTFVTNESVGSGSHWHIETPAFFVLPETVGQLTGLTDIDGIELYEGDNVDCIANSGKSGETETITFNNGSFTFRHRTVAIGEWLNGHEGRGLKLIGNIHEPNGE